MKIFYLWKQKLRMKLVDRLDIREYGLDGILGHYVQVPVLTV